MSKRDVNHIITRINIKLPLEGRGLTLVGWLELRLEASEERDTGPWVTVA